MEPPTTSTPQVAFISGPLDTGPEASYFHTYYTPRIDAAIASGHNFIIGPIPYGVDADALEYLLRYPIDPSRITIFVTAAENGLWGDKFRRLTVNVRVLGDLGATPRQRDAAMTSASSYDILRWRRREEAREFYGKLFRDGHVTNTERNWRRRKGLSEDAVVREEDVDVFQTETETQKRRFSDFLK